jgi:hypothetical protein
LATFAGRWSRTAKEKCIKIGKRVRNRWIVEEWEAERTVAVESGVNGKVTLQRRGSS